MEPTGQSSLNFTTSIDPVRNIARIRFAGNLTATGMETAAAEVERLLPDLKPGFRVLANFGQVDTMDLDCVPHLTRIMDLCRQHGVGLVVRILPPSEHDLGIKLLGIVHYRGEVKTLTVDNVAEAERAIA